MNNNKFSPNSISHRDLNKFLTKAKKDISSNDRSKSYKSSEDQEFIDLIKSWSETSQKILIMMNKKETVVTENRSHKSLMALGAMGAYINMALQALKDAEI
tara:strand:- start:974 stop:1276 length:303 start_codon:yes stop_codon:yes gene_type:complete